jgi:lipoate-protein ligase A
VHGEYKVPEGKLVVIDLDVEDGRLHNVELSGDFFLLPEETVWRMMAALEGVPADAGEDELSGRVRDASRGAQLIGITPEGVAVAVRRAVGEGSR